MIWCRYGLALLSLLSLFARIGESQTPPPLPPSLLNRNILPPSPDAAALGKYGEVPVSLYTGVPSISIPIFTLPGRAITVPLALQYHGGGVRPDQVAPWTGMNWTLNAGGVITRTCRGIGDYGNFAFNTRNLPLGITTWCNNQSDNTDPTNYYDFIKEVLSGQRDSQPDLFSFNFSGYSGKIVFDQNGTPYTIPTQPLRIRTPQQTGTGAWELTTPDGTIYTFAAEERSFSGGFTGVTAWYLTQIVSPQNERVNFYYRDYGSYIDYPADNGAGSISTQTVFTGNFGCNSCPRSLSVNDRPTTYIDGKYLWRVASATHRVDLVSTTGRTDQPGARQLNAVRLTYLADSSRCQEFRLRYGTYSNRLFLQQVQRVGIELGHSDVAEPPYVFSYNTLIAGTSLARGTYAVDRWGYYNAAANQSPFLRLRTLSSFQQQLAANRDANPATVTFGLLQRIQYPTGGRTDFEFESNDFANVAGPLYTYTPHVVTACAEAAGPGTPPGGGACSNSMVPTQEISFSLAYLQRIQFDFSAATTDPLDTDPISELDASLDVYSADNSALVASWGYQTGRSLPIEQELPAGNYRVQVRVNEQRYCRAQVQVRYEQRTVQSTKKQLGGGTRIKRSRTYDGLDHSRDQVKEYYYDNDQHTRSTGRLIHQPVFHSATAHIRVSSGGENTNSCCSGLGCETYCPYIIQSADDIATASGTAQGSAVGYDTVSVVQRDGGTIVRTTAVFHNQAVAGVRMDDQVVENQGYASNFDERNGLQLQLLEYVVAKNGDPFRANDVRLTRRVAQQYGSALVPDTAIVGLSIGGSFGDLAADGQEPCRTIMATSYRTIIGWWPLTRTDETRYDALGRRQTSTTRTFYDNAQHLQPSRQEVTGADGQTRITRYKYAADYATSTEPGLSQLQAWHMIGTPVEEQQWVRTGAQPARWLGGKLTRFAASSTARGPLPAELFVAALSAPKAAPAHETVAAGRFTTFLSDADAYQARATLAYSALGQLRQQALVGDAPTSYLWDDAGLRPIAEAVGTSDALMAYTSFEPISPGGWRYNLAGRVDAASYTGRWAFALGAGSSVERRLDTVVPGGFEVTVWSHGNVTPVLQDDGVPVAAPVKLLSVPSGWQLWRWRVSPAAGHTLTLVAPTGHTIWVDELRLYPVGAHLTSLTYDALNGLASKTDPSGRTTRYEYDALGRLLRVRDEQGRLLTEQEYKYASQP